MAQQSPLQPAAAKRRRRRKSVGRVALESSSFLLALPTALTQLVLLPNLTWKDTLALSRVNRHLQADVLGSTRFWQHKLYALVNTGDIPPMGLLGITPASFDNPIDREAASEYSEESGGMVDFRGPNAVPNYKFLYDTTRRVQQELPCLFLADIRTFDYRPGSLSLTVRMRKSSDAVDQDEKTSMEAVDLVLVLQLTTRHYHDGDVTEEDVYAGFRVQEYEEYSDELEAITQDWDSHVFLRNVASDYDSRALMNEEVNDVVAVPTDKANWWLTLRQAFSRAISSLFVTVEYGQDPATSIPFAPVSEDLTRGRLSHFLQLVAEVLYVYTTYFPRAHITVVSSLPPLT